ncbi:MAG: UDP-N-acetylmuramoyl-tripeptide--D-alanyl-D-alanine ligase [Deltaproteobacteria bacterium]|jgi:UDP-N-acetylmuramoyl-tripeptide--D-alanyl-D-alanine ligase|nr:UDP-N-acetylmuramoyl-tripeptide--D-alanyl-D-alanine ligase [Deltaproteobacteria bacterium]
MGNEPKIPWTTAEILEATKGDLLCGDIKHTFEGVSIDSRTISANELFIAIKGNVYDGHSFASDVISSGVRGLIISKDKVCDPAGTDWQDKGIVCVKVNDTTKALGDLASFNRMRTDVSVVAITGSNGKTTTREMTASVVSTRYKTLSSKGNFNNEIGLPLTLLDLKNSHQWAVLELGMNRPGEIDRLGEICIPDIGVITNIGFAHLEGLGSIEGVMNAKGELLKRIKPEGTAVLNADDSRVLYLSTKTSKKVLYFGLSEDARIKALNVNETTTGISFTLVLPEERIPIELRVFGRFMVSNALAAASVGYIIGLSSEEIKAGLEYFQPVKGRINIFDVRGVHIIDDTYNANPDSMEAAIRTLSSLKGNSRGILVAGDMLELGEHAESMHRKIGALSARSNIARLYITGEFAEAVANGAGKEDKNSIDIFIGAKEEIVEDLKKSLLPGDWVLVKGSRAMGMEKIVEGLKI